MGVIHSSGLGTPERLTKLEEMRRRKTEHGETNVGWYGKFNIGI